jgi:protoporphyrinogen oxidase
VARVAIIGAGISGLASAHYLLKAGLRPVVFEASSQIGGLGTYFEHAGHSFERFYHVMLDSDADLLELIGELGLSGDVAMREARMGFYMGGRAYPLNSAADLLRFDALGLGSRLRVGVAGLALRIARGDRPGLDHVTARDWLRDSFGAQALDRIWTPLLRAKFGDAWDQVPAYWMWSRLVREKGSSKEVKGQLRGGYRRLAEALRDSIVARGGEFHLNCPVTAIGGTWLAHAGWREEFDAVISTLPLPGVQYQGVVNVVLVSLAPLQPYYWTAVVDQRFPFQGVVETTNVIPLEWTGGRHLIYLMNYGADDGRNDDQLRRAALEGLAALHPKFRESDVEAAYVFRARYVEPVWTLGYLARRPTIRDADTGVYRCTTAQAYPRVNSWNTMVALAKETVAAVTAGCTCRPRQ